MSALAGRLAEALKMCASVLADDGGTDANDWIDAESAARAALAEYQATPRAYFPADYIREKLERYDAEIADGTVSYPFYAGCFSQVARGMLERMS